MPRLWMIHQRKINRPNDLMKSLVGSPAVPFELPDSSGKMHKLADYRGQQLLMVFHRHLS